MELLDNQSFTIVETDCDELAVTSEERVGLHLVAYADLLEQEQKALHISEIKKEARQKAQLLIDEVLECSHPALLADFLNDRVYKANENSGIYVKYKNLILDLNEELNVDPRSLILLNYAKILQILKDVEMKSPDGGRFDTERKVLNIEIPE